MKIESAAPRSVRFVVLATLLLAVSHFDRQIFAILSPTVTRELAIDDAAYGVLAGAFSVAYLVGPPLAALFLDRVGLRRGLVLAVVLWSLVAAFHGLATTFAGLLVLRLALGFAESPSFPAATRIVERAVAGPPRARAIGFMLIGASLGAVVAAPLASGLSARFGFRIAFLGTAAAGLLWVPAFLLVARGPGGAHVLERRTDSTRRPERGTLRRALATKVVWRTILGVVAFSPVAAFALLWGAKLLVVRCGVPEHDVGKLLWIPPVFYDLGAIGFGELKTRFGSRKGAERALFLCAAALSVALAFVGALGGSATTTVALAAVALAGVAGCGAINTSVLVDRIPAELTTVGAGLLAAAQALVFALASVVIGLVVDALGGPRGFDAATLGVSLWCGLFASVWVFWRPVAAGPVATATGPSG